MVQALDTLPEIQGMVEWDTLDGVHVLQVHYTADPHKRSEEWKAESMTGTTESDWQQEMEIDFTVMKGLPWYPEFKATMHVANNPLTPIASAPVIRGWDYGLTPATVFIQVTATGRVLVHAPDIQSWESGIVAHTRKVQAASATYFPNHQFYDYGDPSGNQRAQTDEKTCVQVLREDFGIYVKNGPTAFNQRDIPIRKMFTTLIEGSPAIIIDPRCSWLIEALKGGYHRMEVNGEILDRLEDNKYTHIVDAFGYAISMIQYSGNEEEVDMPRLGAL